MFLRHSLLERQLFLRSRLELRRAVHSEDHVKEFLTHYTSFCRETHKSLIRQQLLVRRAVARAGPGAPASPRLPCPGGGEPRWALAALLCAAPLGPKKAVTLGDN